MYVDFDLFRESCYLHTLFKIAVLQGVNLPHPLLIIQRSSWKLHPGTFNSGIRI